MAKAAEGAVSVQGGDFAEAEAAAPPSNAGEALAAMREILKSQRNL